MNTPQDFTGFVYLLIDLINTAIPIVGGIALLAFFWGLANFIRKADNEDARKEGRQIMFWGIISIFVLVSVWGIVLFLARDIFGFSTIGVPQLPIAP